MILNITKYMSLTVTVVMVSYAAFSRCGTLIIHKQMCYHDSDIFSARPTHLTSGRAQTSKLISRHSINLFDTKYLAKSAK